MTKDSKQSDIDKELQHQGDYAVSTDGGTNADGKSKEDDKKKEVVSEELSNDDRQAPES